MRDHLERVGQTIGDYRLLRWLGGGGFGHVYEALHLHDSQRVALKVLKMRLTQAEDLRAFLNEASAIRLRHPHILPLLNFGLSRQEEPFLVMEYAPLGTLRDRHPKGSRVPLPTVVEYATQIASALQHAHDQRVVHRDVKPENILVGAYGMLLLADFGIATTAYSTRSLGLDQGVGGTVLYMAPEQLDGRPRIESDQYELAVVIYEWLVGQCPFQGTSVEVAVQHALKAPQSLVEQVPGVPPEVEAVLFRALAKSPKDRFASIQEFLSAFQQASSLPTFRRPELGVSEQPFLKEISSGTPQPVAMLPSVENPLTLFPSSVEPITWTANQEPTLTTGKERTSRAIGSMSQELSPTSPTRERSVLSRHKRGLSKGHVALVLLIVFLLLAISGGSYAYQTSVSISHMQATATADTDATATARVAPTATVNAAIDSYNNSVATRGIMFGFDAQGTHYNPYERILKLANISRLQQKWATPTGGQIWSSPTVANGVVYVGSLDGKLYAFDTVTGQQKWVAPTGDKIYSSPAVANGVVYVGSYDGKLYAFNATTGGQEWVASTGDQIAPAPAVANGVVYIGTAADKLYAFAAATGQQEWVAPAGGQLWSSPAVADGVVYIGSLDSKLYAFDTVTGQQKWVAPTGGQIWSSPAVANGVVYVGSYDGKLYAFDTVTGQQKWVAPTGDKIYSSPAVANGVVYVGSYDGKLYAFDIATGGRKWISAPAASSQILSSPAVANGVVYVGSSDNKLYAFSLA